MFSRQIRDFFFPIFLRYKGIFFLLLLDGAITGIFSVITPILLKLETDQLMEKKSYTFFTSEFSGFQVFIGILIIILLSELISRIISQVSQIMLDAKKDYLRNHIQLELFNHMKVMEVGRAINSRFKNLTRILEVEFNNFPEILINLPRDLLQKTIQIFGLTAVFIYFDIRFLGIVMVSSILSYIISRYTEILRKKYEIQWKFSLGQKIYFYSDLFLRHFTQLATNGAIKTTLHSYEKVLEAQIQQGLKKNWADLVWTISHLFTGSVSNMLIKIIVGYSVFIGTQSIGMVALVVASMRTIEDVMTSCLMARRQYLKIRFQESSILLFLEMCEKVGTVDAYTKDIQQIRIENLGFSYPNLSEYEKKYLDTVKQFTKWGKTGSRWMDEAFENLIKTIEEDVQRTMPEILQNVSITLAQGKIYGIVGKNGAGKTTLMQLLSGFFRKYSWTIYFNSEDTRDFMPDVFASHISFLTQEPFFMSFGSTIRENVFLGVNNPNEDILWEYLEKFNLAKKIQSAPEGLDSEVGDQIDFSGGEKQILAFIRLLLQDRQVIIMDEWTNQLDAENEIIVMNELLKKKSEKIIIFITHRMSTISKADQIFCLDHHTILQSGSHKELLATKDNVYAKFYETQVMHENVI